MSTKLDYTVGGEVMSRTLSKTAQPDPWKTLQRIAVITAGSNSEPDVMGRALDGAIAEAQKALKFRQDASRSGKVQKAAKVTADLSELLETCDSGEGAHHLLIVKRTGELYVLHAAPYDSDDDAPEGAAKTCHAYALHLKRQDGRGEYAETGPCWSDCEHKGHLSFLIEQADDAGLFDEVDASLEGGR